MHVLAIGAHPDDCDTKFGGTAALFAKMGHHVKFLALTSGDAGHQSQGGGALASRRRAEAAEGCGFEPAGRRMVKGFTEPITVKSLVSVNTADRP